jgi:Flp pilus assembly protein TadD
MQIRTFSRPTHRLVRLIPLLLALGFGAARAAEFETAQKQWLAGQRTQAVATIEQGLVKMPDDLKLRFALGVMKMEMGQPQAAQTIFTALTQDFPDLADPYNNLAVIQASQGELDQARAALEQAVRLQPDHPQALENLGDVLLQLALRAYQRAQTALAVPSEPLALKLGRTQQLLQTLTPAKP